MMKKILPLLVVGILVLSGLGVAAITSNKATMDNHPPDMPTVAGTLRPKARVAYEYTIWTTDPDGDDVRYHIDWGDGKSDTTGYNPEGTDVKVSHTWDEKGCYLFRCKANDTHGAESDWYERWLKVWDNKAQSSQQSSSIPSSQNTVNVISSTGKIDVTISRTTIYDGSLSGYVNDTSMNPIEGARVRVSFHETYEEDYSDSNGYYHVTNIPICYCLKNATCSKEDYKTEWVLLSIVENTTHDFVLTSENHPPSAPYITGSTNGKVGEEYYYTFNAVDPDEDDVKYYIDWGDGNSDTTDFNPSGTDVTVRHTYHIVGYVTISARAKDIYGAIGNESTLTFHIGKSKSIVNSMLLWFLEQFPILRHLLRL